MTKVSAATFVVNTANDTQDAVPGNGACADSGGLCSLRAAITEANSLAGADIITLPAGTYTQTLAAANEDANAGGDWDITSAITINGAGAATTIIQANAAALTANERVIHVFGATPVIIAGVTIRNGVNRFATAPGGGGIRLEGATANLTLNNSTLTDNWSESRGGGIQVSTQGAALTMNNCTVSNNRAGSDVGGTDARGGGIDVFGTAATPGSTVNINNTVLNGNTANSSTNNAFGAGMTVTQTNAIVNVTGSTFSNGTSTATGSGFIAFAGGIYVINATLNLTGSTITGNAATDHAGLRVLAGPIGPTTVNVTNSTISNNVATDQGGGITNLATSSTESSVTVDGSTISGNSVTAADGLFGAILNSSSAGQTGGANMFLTNSTVSGNSAPDVAGVYSDGETATLFLNFCTVTANVTNNTVAPTGGGIYQDTTVGGVTFIQNTVVAHNVAEVGPDIFGEIFSLDYNIVEDPADGTFTTSAHDETGVDPLLGPLANNGGPTQTHVPGAGSAVIDKIPNGTNDCGVAVTTDQRGSVRPFGGTCDKGSVEVGAAGTPTPTNTPTATPTNTPTATPTNTPTATPTNTPTATPTNTPTATPTNTPTATPTNTPTATPTATPTNTPTATPTPSFTPQHVMDFDGDGKTDYAVVRNTGGGPGGQITWFTKFNGGSNTQFDWGISTDSFAPADYDGDNKTDIAVWRSAPAGSAAFYIFQSATGTVRALNFGQTGDDARVMGDYTGDGKADPAIYRAGATAGAQSTWWYLASSGPNSGLQVPVQWGLNGDFPAPGDYDGDGKADFAVQRNNGGGQARFMFLLATGSQANSVVFGTPTDVIVPGDYDGDGKTDIATIRGSGGAIQWWIRPSSTGVTPTSPILFGVSATDFPTQGDYDGDGKTDIAIWRPNADPAQNYFWTLGSTAGVSQFEWGQNGDYPVANVNSH